MMVKGYEDQRLTIVRAVHRDQSELHKALSDLRAAARNEWEVTRERLQLTKAQLSVRRRVEQHPFAFVAGAFATGIWIGWKLDLFGAFSDDD